MTSRELSLSTLKRVAETSVALADAIDSGEPVPPKLLQDRLDAMAAYRAEVAPVLRTRAEVDAEIAAKCRLRRNCGPFACEQGSALSDQLTVLIQEETAPDPTELGACPPECSECATLGPPIDASFPEPCSCEESSALHARLQRIHQLTLTYEPNSREGAVDCIRAIRKASE